MTDYVVDFNLDDEDLNADFDLDEGEVFNAILQLDVAGSLWGNISGELSNQTDLQAALDLKADKTEVESVTGALSDSITAVADNLQSEATTRADNDVILQNNINNLSDSLTAEIGNRTSADTILQGNINALDDKVDSLTGALDDRIDTLSDTVTANYNTLDDKIDSVNGALSDSINAVDNKYNSITGGLSDDIDALESVVSANFTTLSDSISAEITNRQNADSIIGDSITALDSITSSLSDSISAIDSTIGGYGDIVNYNAADFATSIQGALADTALQPNDDISKLNNDVGFITAASLPTVNNATITIQKNGTTVESFTLNQSTNKTVNISVPTTAADVNALPNTTSINDLTTSAQQAALNSGANTTNIGQIATNTNAISTEVTDRQNADIALQNQIDAIVSSSDVFDIVGTYAELQAYDIATVPVNDIIKVLVDSTHNDAATYYRCTESGGVKSWSYIGSEGAYYTKGEADGLFVPQTRTVNGKALNNNISLTASDVGALPDSTVIPTVNNSTITIQKNGAAVDTFTLNQSTAKTINITVPTDTNDLTNGAGYITGITSGDVTTALGYTPYNSSNPDGFITSADLPTNYVTTDTDQNITGVKTFVGDKRVKFKGSTSSSKLGFTAYDNNNREVGYLEAQGQGNASHKCRLGIYDTNTSNYDNVLGFEYYKGKGSDGSLHRYSLLCPPLYPSTTDANYYIPMAITDGNTTVTADNTGSVDISSLLPTVPTNISAFTNDSGYITSSALSPYALSSSLATVATSGSYNDLTNKPTIPTVDQTYDGTSTNAQSGVAIEGELSTNYVKSSAENTSQGITSSIGYVSGAPLMQTNYSDYQFMCGCGAGGAAMAAIDTSTGNATGIVTTPTALLVSQGNQQALLTLSSNNNLVINGTEVQEKLVSGTNIKTINNTSLLGSGNIDTSEIFVATSSTTYAEITAALLNYKLILFIDGGFCYQYSYSSGTEYQFSRVLSSYSDDIRIMYYSVDTSNTWSSTTYTAADTDLSNLSATGKTVIDGQWTGKYSQVATNTAVNSYTHNLSSYLPNDGHDYEVFVSIQATYGSANGYLSVGAVASPYSNAGSAGCYLMYAAATGYSRSNALTAIIPVKASNKYIYSQITGGALGSSYIRLYGYRRIGSNT